MKFTGVPLLYGEKEKVVQGMTLAPKREENKKLFSLVNYKIVIEFVLKYKDIICAIYA